MSPPKAIRVPLVCTVCGGAATHALQSLFYAPKVAHDAARAKGRVVPSDWDGWYTPQCPVCARCGAVDSWTVETMWGSRGPTELIRDGVVVGMCWLPDGTLMRRGHQAEQALRALAETSPKPTEHWRHLGNLMSQRLDFKRACESWAKAAEDPDEAESVAYLAVHFSNIGDLQAAVDYACVALERAVKIGPESRRPIVPDLIGILRDEAPTLYLGVMWQEPGPNDTTLINISAVRLDEVPDRRILVRFLSEASLVAVEIGNDRPPGYHPAESRLLALLSGRRF